MRIRVQQYKSMLSKYIMRNITFARSFFLSLSLSFYLTFPLSLSFTLLCSIICIYLKRTLSDLYFVTEFRTKHFVPCNTENMFEKSNYTRIHIEIHIGIRGRKCKYDRKSCLELCHVFSRSPKVSLI